MKKTGMMMTLLLMAGLATRAQESRKSIGLRAGTADAVVGNALSFRYFVKPGIAFEALASVSDPFALGLLVQKHDSLPLAGLSWYYGGGAYLAFGRSQRFGLQGITGLEYRVASLPLSLSLDWKPEVNMVKDFYFEPAVLGLSLRYYW